MFTGSQTYVIYQIPIISELQRFITAKGIPVQLSESWMISFDEGMKFKSSTVI